MNDSILESVVKQHQKKKIVKCHQLQSEPEKRERENEIDMQSRCLPYINLTWVSHNVTVK